ncbi:DUF421 domain-containing protein [Bacillus sp. HMF5848]|uniref:DUF421 domain-containing protein n=1 Tax=Bacillus sp. HMF5848 TaxID=2495421 RepID=UPI000F7AA4CF|nr:DUF421 domain-containing protein [Bacillus sp. HMF5848]RSK26132.1 DUF421 domain-containing protein [Bacillus sp. HMF5848]
MGFLEMTIRCILIFVALYIMARILGKKIIAQMTIFDVVAGITLGSISGSFMFSHDISITVGVYALILFAILTLLIDFIALKSFIGRKILTDEPTLIIKNGKIHEEGMAKARLSVDELLFQLRKKNIFYVDQVDFAFFETDGTVSANLKTEEQPATKKELTLSTPSRGIPQTFIIDGKILKNTLKSLNKDEEWVYSLLKSYNVNKISDVFIAQIDEREAVFIDKRVDHSSL